MRRARGRHRSLAAWRVPVLRTLRILAAACAVGIAARLAIRVKTPSEQALLNELLCPFGPPPLPCRLNRAPTIARRGGWHPVSRMQEPMTSSRPLRRSAATLSGSRSRCRARPDARTMEPATLRRDDASAHRTRTCLQECCRWRSACCLVGAAREDTMLSMRTAPWPLLTLKQCHRLLLTCHAMQLSVGLRRTRLLHAQDASLPPEQ